MNKLNTSIAIVAASVFMAGSAMAASFQPASGMAPLFDANVATNTAPSTLTRSAVEAQAVAAMPASGNAPFVNDAASTPSTLTRAEVRAQAIANPPAAGVMNGYEAVATGNHAAPNNAQAARDAANNRL